jgi:hypothetical protein
MSNAGGSPAPGNSANQASISLRKSTPDLLRHVLEATLARGTGEMTAEELQSLQAIARSILQADSTEQLDMALIAERLVACLLTTRFPDLGSAEANRQMCQRIATSLCGDPTSMQRLKTLWNQLQQSIT